MAAWPHSLQHSPGPTLTGSSYDTLQNCLCSNVREHIGSAACAPPCKAHTCELQPCGAGCAYKCCILSCYAANREREFIRMLMSASITYEIARACREKLIPDCHCAPSNLPFINNTGGKLIIAGCDVDMSWAAAYTRLIMDGSNDRIAQHNIEVGIAVSGALGWEVKGIDQ